MYEVSFFRDRADRFCFATTRDRTGAVLPPDRIWDFWFSDQFCPERGRGPELEKFEAGFAERGYYLYPRKNI